MANTGSFCHFCFLFFFLSGGGRRILQEIDSLKTTHMLEYLVFPSDLVQVTTHRRIAGAPIQWAVVLFPDRCSLRHPVNVHGLFSFGGAGSMGRRCGQGREGHCSIFIKLLLHS